MGDQYKIDKCYVESTLEVYGRRYREVKDNAVRYIMAENYQMASMFLAEAAQLKAMLSAFEEVRDGA